ncbi:MAG: flagellar hook-length control protein FliK, partial [Calditrichaeota bacterium]|nr:flagellar hook-length control protein FliK [Calditrichota bacterium]
MRTPNLLGLPEKPQAINSEALSRKAKVVAQLFFSGEGVAAQTVRGGEKKPEAAPQAGVKKESLTGDDDEKIKSQQPDPTWVEGDREVPVDARTLFPEAAEQISLLEKNLLLRRKGDKTPAVAPGEKKDAEVRIVAAPDHGLEKEGTAPLARGGSALKAQQEQRAARLERFAVQGRQQSIRPVIVQQMSGAGKLPQSNPLPAGSGSARTPEGGQVAREGSQAEPQVTVGPENRFSKPVSPLKSPVEPQSSARPENRFAQPVSPLKSPVEPQSSARPENRFAQPVSPLKSPVGPQSSERPENRFAQQVTRGEETQQQGSAPVSPVVTVKRPLTAASVRNVFSYPRREMLTASAKIMVEQKAAGATPAKEAAWSQLPHLKTQNRADGPTSRDAAEKAPAKPAVKSVTVQTHSVADSRQPAAENFTRLQFRQAPAQVKDKISPDRATPPAVKSSQAGTSAPVPAAKISAERPAPLENQVRSNGEKSPEINPGVKSGTKGEIPPARPAKKSAVLPSQARPENTRPVVSPKSPEGASPRMPNRTALKAEATPDPKVAPKTPEGAPQKAAPGFAEGSLRQEKETPVKAAPEARLTPKTGDKTPAPEVRAPEQIVKSPDGSRPEVPNAPVPKPAVANDKSAVPVAKAAPAQIPDREVAEKPAELRSAAPSNPQSGEKVTLRQDRPIAVPETDKAPAPSPKTSQPEKAVADVPRQFGEKPLPYQVRLVEPPLPEPVSRKVRKGVSQVLNSVWGRITGKEGHAQQDLVYPEEARSAVKANVKSEEQRPKTDVRSREKVVEKAPGKPLLPGTPTPTAETETRENFAEAAVVSENQTSPVSTITRPKSAGSAGRADLSAHQGNGRMETSVAESPAGGGAAPGFTPGDSGSGAGKRESSQSGHQPTAPAAAGAASGTAAPPPANPAAASLPTPVAVVQHIVQVINQQRGNRSKTSFQLDGGDLGKLEIKFERSEGSTRTTILVESEEARQTLEKLLPDIEKNLLDKGLHYESIAVDIHDKGAQDGENRSGRGGSEKSGPIQSEEQKTADAGGEATTAPRDYGYNSMEVVA